MKSVIIFFFLSFSVLSINAQSNFKAGYIITNENDTINGFVDFRTSAMNAKSCRFRVNEAGEIKTYYPSEISGYRFVDEGKFYVSRNIEIEGLKQEVFLEYLLKGIVDLYYYVDPNEYYFFENEQGKMIGINKKEDKYIYHERLKANVVRHDNTYIGVLKNIFQDSQSAMNNIDKVKYKQEDIINITKRYHDDVCTTGEGCIIFETKKDNNFTNKKITLYAGFQNYSLKLYDDEDRFPDDFPDINSWYPTIGAQLNLSVPRWAKSISFQLDVALSGMKGSSVYNKTYNNINSFRRIYDFKTLLSTNKLGVKYTHWSDKFCPTIEGGISTIFLFATSSTYSMEEFNPPRMEKIYDDIWLPKGGFLGYYGAFGVDYLLKDNKAIVARIGYESHISVNYMSAISKGPKIKAISFKLGYTF